MIFHGRVRLTGDVAFYYDRDRANAGRLYPALEEFRGGAVPGITAAGDLAEPGVITQFGNPPNRIDLINEIAGVSFEEAWGGRVEATMVGGAGDVPVPNLGRAELIANKQAAGRPKDLDDLAYLMARPG